MQPTLPPGLADDGSYAVRLRRLIGEPKRQMLLDANVVWNRTHPSSPPTDRAVFETASERFHRTVLTLWELFDERAEYAECVVELAKRARELRNERRYSIIVTSTAPARHLAQNLQPEIEADDEPIVLRHLGPYPLVGEKVEVPSFAGENVLLLGDVVDSGRALGNLAKAVRALGGTPVAALCLVLVGSTLIAEWERKGNAPVFRPADGASDGAPIYTLTCDTSPGARRGETEGIPLHTITCSSLPEVKRGEFDSEKAIRLDPETQLPTSFIEQRLIYPAIDRNRMYQHLERSKAINTDLFRTENGLVTTAVRLPRLFEHAGDEIWETVEPHLKLDPVHPGEPTDTSEPRMRPILVTTYDRGDIRFKEFVEDRWKGDPLETVLVGRRSDGEYFILDHRIELLRSRRVILLLASAQTAQKIRDLSALLASLSVRSIRVVCLLNRMGTQTAHFVGRIARLLRGLGGDRKKGDSQIIPRVEEKRQGSSKPEDKSDRDLPFSFHPTYQLDDLPADRLRVILDTVHSLFDYYHNETRVPSFRRWLVQVRGYFTPRPVTSHEFATKDPDALPRQQIVHGPDDEGYLVSTEDAMLSVLASRVVTDRKYKAIIEQLVAANGRRAIYKLFALLLADVGYMKKTGQFRELRDELEKRVTELQKRRLEIEKEVADDSDRAEELKQIDHLVDLETHLLFGWALLSFLDQGFDYTALVFKILSGGVSNPIDWQKHPETFERFYGEERMAWVVSFLTTLSHPGFGKSEQAPELKRRLTKYLRDLVATLPKIFASRATGGDTVDHAKSRELRVKSNLDLLLAEFGAHELQEPVQVIRYLHSQLLKPRQRHSPIDTNINQAIEGLDRVLRRSPARTAVTGRRVPFTDSEVLARLDDGIYVAGQLQTMSDTATRLLFFAAPSDPANARANNVSTARYFTAQPPDAGFAHDVSQLGDILQKIRGDKRVSVDEYTRLGQLKTRILDALWGERSALRVALVRYITPLEPTITAALEAAMGVFAGQRYEKAWKHEWEQFAAVEAKDAHCVLIDPLLLKEILKNVFTNVRYNLAEYDKPKGVRYAHLVQIQISAGTPITIGGAAEQLPRLRVVVVTKGKKFRVEEFESKTHSTFRQHQDEVAKIGGELHIRSYQDKEHKGTQVELILIDRTEYRPSSTPPASNTQ
jgi:hypothetical protein